MDRDLFGTTSVVTDHGDLEGLGDDDHTQYILVSGNRAYTGGQTFADVADAINSGSYALQFQSGIANVGGDAFSFASAITLTSGNLLNFKNLGGSVFSVDYIGKGSFSGGITAGSGHTDTGTRALIVGLDNSNNAANSVTLGYLNTNSGGTNSSYAIVMGQSNTYTYGWAGFAIGRSNTVSSLAATKASGAIGEGNTITTGNYTYQLGKDNNATSNQAVQVGQALLTTANKSTQVGQFLSQTTTNSGMTLGYGVGAGNELVNASADMYLGMNSTIPTLVVGVSAGAGTVGTTTAKGDLVSEADIFANTNRDLSKMMAMRA